VPSLIVVDVIVVVGRYAYCSGHFNFARDDIRNDAVHDRKATMMVDETDRRTE
jgi:hypothetical protein